LKIIYVTDLHGDRRKYHSILDAAARHGAGAVVNGGDIYPKDVELLRQGEFVEGFLDAHLGRYDRAGIRYLSMPANDDLAAFDPLFDRVCAAHPMAESIAGRKVALGGCEFIGFNLVVDYPFRLKDRCRVDDEHFAFGMQLGTALVSRGRWPEAPDLAELDDWFAHAKSLPSIKRELARLPEPGDPARAVYVIHMPPTGLGLDVCSDGRAVGSRAARELLLEREPLLSLHGHIHESPRVTGKWKGRLGRTWCVQPGQLTKLAYVVVDLEAVEFERVEE